MIGLVPFYIFLTFLLYSAA